MTWVAVAIGGGALLTAGASYAGSKKQAQASQNAAGLNMDMFNILNRQQQPYIQSGYGAMSRLNTLLGLSPRPGSMPSMGSPAYRPTPGGGVQPIMPTGPDIRLNDPYPGGGGTSFPLQRILMLRAMHGDTQAGQMLQRMQ